MKTKFTKTKTAHHSVKSTEEEAMRMKKLRHRKERFEDDFFNLSDINITHIRNIDVNSLFNSDDKLFL